MSVQDPLDRSLTRREIRIFISSTFRDMMARGAMCW